MGNKRQTNKPLPAPQGRIKGLNKDKAYATLAVEEFSHNLGTAKPPLSSDLAVEEARHWVEYDEL